MFIPLSSESVEGSENSSSRAVVPMAPGATLPTALFQRVFITTDEGIRKGVVSAVTQGTSPSREFQTGDLML